MDEYLRRLERLAASGDLEAVEKLRHWQEKLRAPLPKYFHYSQNNIMGFMHSIPSKGIGSEVVIEAFDEDHADDRLRTLVGDSYYGYCECCGSRWKNIENTFENRDRLSSWWRNYTRYGREDCYLHLLDGTVVPCQLRA